MTRARALLIAGFVAMLGALLPVVLAGRASATAGPQIGRIAFDACGDTGCDVYTANPDGTGVQQVTQDGASVMPDWSPDGRRLAYASLISGTSAIWIADADGGNARQLTPDEADASNLWPRFTPDGRSILYTNCLGDDCDGGLSAIDVDGSDQRVITPNSGDSYNLAAPSPDGKRITFMRWHVGGVHMRLFQLRLGDTRERALTPPALEAWAPDWSPDGKKILFSSNLFANRPNGAIYSMDTDGGSIRQLGHPPFPLEDFHAAYGPDGNRIVFASSRRHPGRDGSDLFTMRADGSHVEAMQLPATLSQLFVEWPRWSGTAVQPSLARKATIAAPRSVSARRLCAALPAPVSPRLCR